MRPTRIKGIQIMGKIIKTEKYYDMEDCDWRGYPKEKVREIEVEATEEEWRDIMHDRL